MERGSVCVKIFKPDRTNPHPALSHGEGICHSELVSESQIEQTGHVILNLIQNPFNNQCLSNMIFAKLLIRKDAETSLA